MSNQHERHEKANRMHRRTWYDVFTHIIVYLFNTLILYHFRHVDFRVIAFSNEFYEFHAPHVFPLFNGGFLLVLAIFLRLETSGVFSSMTFSTLLIENDPYFVEFVLSFEILRILTRNPSRILLNYKYEYLRFVVNRFSVHL